MPDEVPQPQSDLPLNSIVEGDCLEKLRAFPAACIHLVYIDPPFGSGKSYESIRSGTSHSFDDKFSGVKDYVEWIRPRVSELRRVLRPTGTLFFHCDWHAGHYVKALLDEQFGYSNFLNEIVWRYGLGGSSKRYLPRKHDTIFWYAKDATAPYAFNAPLVPATSQRMKGEMKKLDAVWSLPSLNNMARERLGYPTQKPQTLLERIVAMASNEGEIVLDAFCGSGTTLAAAQALRRQWIGIDNSADAVELARKRLGQ
jgi:DNA modification methylase